MTEAGFWIELSYRYGLPVRLLKKIILAAEFKDLYYRELYHPHWSVRLEYAVAQLNATLINVHLDKDATPITVSETLIEFKPVFGDVAETKDAMTLEETENLIKRVFS